MRGAFDNRQPAVCNGRKSVRAFRFIMLVAGLPALWRADAVADEPPAPPAIGSEQPSPSAPAPAAADDEMPKAQARTYGEDRHVTESNTPKTRAPVAGDDARVRTATDVPRPTMGVGLEGGIAYGGDELVTATLSNGKMEGIQAGSGLFLALTAHWTPFWFNDTAGLGLALSAGGKVDEISASNGEVKFERFPLAASLQLLVPAVDRWFMLVRGGVVKEIGAALSGDGFASGLNVDFASKLGAFGDWGFYRAIGRHGGLVVLFRYTRVGYTLGGADVDGSGIALAVGWQFMR
jgi:hypothetical protein